MKKMKMKPWISGILALFLLGTSVLPTAEAEEQAEQEQQMLLTAAMPVLLTEIYPDDKSNQEHIEGAGSADLFEFVEIYNNSADELAFNEHYQVRYDYGTLKNLTVTTMTDGSDVRIAPHSPAVLWVQRTSSSITGDAANLTEAQFRSYHSMPEDVAVFKLHGQDGLNNVDRGFQLTDKDDLNQIISQIHYSAADVGDGLSLHLQLPASGSTMATYEQKGAPSAGLVDAEQLIPAPATEEPGGEDPDSGDPGTDPSEPGEEPALLITEILPNPAGDYRRGSGNQYEFIELYNNTAQSVDLSGYTLWYLYPGSTAPKRWVIPESQAITLEPYGTGVIWFAKEAVTAGYTTTDDFNTHFNSMLTDEQIVFYDNKESSDFNLPNALHRGLALASKDTPDEYIVEAWYDASTDDSPDREVNTQRNAVIRYKVPAAGTRMERLGIRAYANPGSLDPDQVTPVDGKDNIAPVLQHEQTAFNIGVGHSYPVQVVSNEELDEIEILYGPAFGEGAGLTEKLSLIETNRTDGRYVYSGALSYGVPGAYRYIIAGTDKAGNRTRLPYNSLGALLTVNEKGTESELPEPGLSIGDSAQRGLLTFFGYGETAADDLAFTFDGKTVTARPALPGDAEFGLQTRGIDQIYQATVSAFTPAGGLQYLERLYPRYTEGAWTLLTIPAVNLVSSNIVSVHTGNENSPYDRSIHDKVFGKNNHDDFEISNMHLVLPDGSLVKPERMVNYLGNLTETTVIPREDTYYGLGDADSGTNTGKPMISELHFPIPEDKYTARYAEIDTSGYEDGVYTLAMTKNGMTLDVAEVTVDNTNPVIEAVRYDTGLTLTDGMQLKGRITLDVDTSDVTSGIARKMAMLNGTSIELPYSTSSAQLTAGMHELQVTVADHAGNEASTKLSFVIADERPLAPTAMKPADKGAQVSAGSVELSAVVSDSDNDTMKAGFYEAGAYDFARGKRISGYANVADREPPLVIAPNGEEPISGEAAQQVSLADGEYLVTDSQSGFPYHRFTVDLEEQLRADDEIELYWKGKTLPGRIVTMYAWDYETDKWIALTAESGDAAESDIELSAAADPERFVKDNQVQVMVQDEVEEVNKPFTVLWMTDTQYYAESYPDIFDTLGDWTAEEYKKGAFEYMIHTGDIVNVANSHEQWEVADRNLKKWDEAGVPYGVLAGNHDMIVDGIDYSYYHQYVGADRYRDNPWYGGEMDNNRNHYDLMSFGGHDFIFLYIGFGLEDTPETIQWANEVLAKHADRNAILGMHAYLESNGTLSNMAQNIFDQVIVPNENIKLVLSGHYHAANRVVKKLTNKDGSERQVIEMLADYQGGPNGGNGFVRLLTFDPLAEELDIKTYSPVLDEYNFYKGDEADRDEFTESFAFHDINKRVATDYFAVNVYRNVLIGEQVNLQSGDTAKAVWRNLQGSTTYYWYMKIEDELGAVRRTRIQRFTTAAVPSGVTPPWTPVYPPVTQEPGDDETEEPGEVPSTPDRQGSSLTVPVAIRDGQAVIAPDEAALTEAMTAAAADSKGRRTVTIRAELAGEPHNGAYVLELQGERLSRTSGAERYRLITPIGEATLPSDMLLNRSAQGKRVMFVISPAEGVSGGRPAVDVSLLVDGHPAGWADGTTPVSLTLPYNKAASEHADNLVVWYIDPAGDSEPVINSLYNDAAGGLTFAVRHFSRYAVAYHEVSYRDVNEAAWYFQGINFLSARELVQGMGDGSFQPGALVTRADFLIMVMRVFGIAPDSSDGDQFADAGNRYYTSYLAAAKRMGIVQGVGDNRFAPEQSVSRQDMMVILHGIMSTLDLLPIGMSGADLGGYADASQVSPYAVEAVSVLLATSLIEGVGDAQLDPRGTASRAMSAQVMYNYLAQ
ncbi:S-layer homology domain-containing protein [Paenibacillus sp. 1P07SE]|uniref:S-layer homology domain-containing protein n=1 Tax=Paenibacillus sp. 1P07SE TaxID=3132209 RepID=UPI0039A67EBE